MKEKMQGRESKKKHIAFYIGSLHKGGAERVFVNLAEYFLAEGCCVTMVTQYHYPAEEEYELPEGAERVVSDISEQETGKSRVCNFFRRMRKLHRIWKSYQPDLVLSCIGKNNFMAIVTTWFTRTKPVVSVVGEAGEEYPGRLMRTLARLLFPLAGGIILQTERSKQFFGKGVQKKAVILPNSLNPDFIKERYEGERTKEIVSVGRLDKNKNHEMMIRAFAELAQKYPEHRLVIYGEGELRAYLENLVKELGLEKRISLPGVIPDVADRIQKAEVFLLTSYSEGVSNALIEALALGLPVIATDVPSGGTQELIRDGENGIVIPAGDQKALEKALDRILSDPEYAQELGRNAARIGEKLAPDRVNALWKSYFDSVIQGTSKFRTAVQAVIFCLLFLFLLISVSYMVRTNGDVKDRFSGFYAEKNDTLDIVMIGSSPVFPYYSAPMLWGDTGIAMYPLSSNVQRPEAMRYLVEEAEKSQSPSLYIFEMRMYTFDQDGLSENMAYTRGVTDNLKYSLHRVRTIQALVPEDDADGRMSYYIDIMKYHTNWKMLALPSEWMNFAYHKKNPMKGFEIKDEVGPLPMPECGGATGEEQLPEGQEETLRELLEFLKTNEMDALFIVSPYGESLREQQMYNYMEKIMASYGYPFLNFNNYYEELGIAFEEDFADYGSHTNVIGAEKCTEYLEKYLKEHYQFEDKRGTATYRSWDEAYELWQTKAETARGVIKERIAKGEYAEREE